MDVGSYLREASMHLVGREGCTSISASVRQEKERKESEQETSGDFETCDPK